MSKRQNLPARLRVNDDPRAARVCGRMSGWTHEYSPKSKLLAIFDQKVDPRCREKPARALHRVVG